MLDARRCRVAEGVAVFVVVVSVLATTGCDPSDEPSAVSLAAPRSEEQRTLDALSRERHSAVVGLVARIGAEWRGASGYTSRRRRASPGDRFAIASTTKTFVATVVLQLVEERLLALNDTVEQWLPGRVRGGKRITVRHLLNHTSGLPSDFTLDVPVNAQPSPAGTAHSYANANYDVLGLIVEKVTGDPVSEVVLDRILRPLGLRHSAYGTAAMSDEDAAAPAWLGVPVHSSADVLVSTAGDLATFFRALFGGDLLGDDALAQMTRTVDAPDGRAGLGVFRLDIPCGVAWGHGGESEYSNHVLAARDGSRVAVVAQNTFGWPGARAAAEELYCG